MRSRSTLVGFIKYRPEITKLNSFCFDNSYDISLGSVTGNLRQHSELHYVGLGKIKTKWTWTDVITPQSPIFVWSTSR